MISEIIIGLFFGTENSNFSIEGKSINSYITGILDEARAQSSDWLVLLFGEKAYEWSMTPRYRSLKDKVRKLRVEVRELL